VAPFNFPLALGTGRPRAPLVAATRCVQTSQATRPVPASVFTESCGMPESSKRVFNLVTGAADCCEDLIVRPNVDGVTDHGSKPAPGISHRFAQRHRKRASPRSGGKNAGHRDALGKSQKRRPRACALDLWHGWPGSRSACSASTCTSRLAKPFMDCLVGNNESRKIVSFRRPSIFLGPLINAPRPVQRSIEPLRLGKQAKDQVGLCGPD